VRAAPGEAGVVRTDGGLTLYLPGAGPPRRRLLDLDRAGHVTLAIRRGAGGELREAWTLNVDGSWLGVLRGGADHPLWGASDRIVQAGAPGQAAVPLTVCAAVAWEAIAGIPPLAEPARLPPGAGTSILNVLAALAQDQDRAALRYRGPYATEQLFWALLESFRYAEADADPLGVFLGGAEAALLAGEAREAPLDWIPAPHARGFGDGGLYVQRRDGVEKIGWEGRAYYRIRWQGLTRREHRVVRRVTTPAGESRVVAGLVALGRPLEDHLVLDADGTLLERAGPVAEDHGPDAPLAEPWPDALAALLPLEATPLLGPAIAAVWPELEVTWGAVSRDLVETREARVRLSRGLVRLYRAEAARRPADGRRALARDLVREVLGLVAPAVRQAAAAWLEAEPPARREALVATAGRLDRATLAARAAPALGRLLDALVAGDAVPADPVSEVPPLPGDA
jgi:hypothetical protein